jgi:hypothetical protein
MSADVGHGRRLRLPRTGRAGCRWSRTRRGVSEETIGVGRGELERGERLERGRVRRTGGPAARGGGGRSGAVWDLERLIDPVTRGDQESLLRWTSRGAAKLGDALGQIGDAVSESTLGKLLRGLDIGCRPTSRPGRATTIRIATGSSNTSTPRSPPRWRRASPRSRSIPGRRS